MIDLDHRTHLKRNRLTLNRVSHSFGQGTEPPLSWSWLDSAVRRRLLEHRANPILVKSYPRRTPHPLPVNLGGGDPLFPVSVLVSVGLASSGRSGRFLTDGAFASPKLAYRRRFGQGWLRCKGREGRDEADVIGNLNSGYRAARLNTLAESDEEPAMPIPRMLVWAWMQISFVIAMFVLSLWISWYLWHMRAGIIASVPLMLYAGVMSLYNMWRRRPL